MPRKYLSSSHYKNKRSRSKSTPSSRSQFRRSTSSRRPSTTPSQALNAQGDRICPPIENKYYTLRNAYPDTSIAGGTSFTGLGLSYALSAMDNITTFLGLFDQYRIDWIEVTVRPMYTATSLSASGDIVPVYKTLIDYDDANTLVNMAGANVYSTVQTGQINSMTRAWQPHCATSVLGGSGGQGNVASPWLDCGFPTVPHYGFKMGIEAGTAGAIQSYNITTNIWVTFKNVR